MQALATEVKDLMSVCSPGPLANLRLQAATAKRNSAMANRVQSKVNGDIVAHLNET